MTNNVDVSDILGKTVKYGGKNYFVTLDGTKREIPSYTGDADNHNCLPDDLTTTTGNIALSPGNGSSALLAIGTSSTTWRKDFDKVTAAQNLADLINKEDRVNKAAVEFVSNKIGRAHV